jgi:hypothetical protein
MMDITVRRSVSAYRLHYPLTAKRGGRAGTYIQGTVKACRDAVATQGNVFQVKRFVIFLPWSKQSANNARPHSLYDVRYAMEGIARHRSTAVLGAGIV